jgi:hypothetical protein
VSKLEQARPRRMICTRSCICTGDFPVYRGLQAIKLLHRAARSRFDTGSALREPAKRIWTSASPSALGEEGYRSPKGWGSSGDSFLRALFHPRREVPDVERADGAAPPPSERPLAVACFTRNGLNVVPSLDSDVSGFIRRTVPLGQIPPAGHSQPDRPSAPTGVGSSSARPPGPGAFFWPLWSS